VPELGTLGSVRGDASNGIPYRDKDFIPGADAVAYAEGNMDGGVSASPWTTRRGLRPWHVRTLLGREPGDLAADRRQETVEPARIGKARSHSR
jgi:hypothetical protein